jgi:DNA polymerase-1
MNKVNIREGNCLDILPTKPKKLYIDADILLYRACFASQSYDPLTERYPDPKELFDESVEKLFKETCLHDYTCCLSSKNNFRKEIFPDYKANRKDRPKPPGLTELRNWVLTQRRGWTVDGLEADDLLGIMATSDPSNLITSLDKDCRTLPNVTWYNFKSGEYETQSPAQARHNFLVQALAGDSVDGYKGIPGIGPKKAEKILLEGGDRWSTVVGAYVRHGLTAQDAFVNASMAHILTSSNFDLDTLAMTPWKPADLLE